MDAESFKKLFLPYHKKLYRIAYRLMEDKENAEDMVQELYIKLWEKRQNLKEVQNAESFAVTILKNICLDDLRKSKHQMTALSSVDIPSGCSLIDQIESADRLEKVEKFIDLLPENQKKIIRLRHIENYSDEEIEQCTGLNRGNIKVIVSRARKTLKELIIKLEKR